jgi:hypothetical protein
VRFYLPNGLLKRAAADLSDLTASARDGECYWDDVEADVLVCPMDPEPSEAEQAAIRRRMVTADAEDEARLHELLDAVTDPGAPPWARLTLRAELARYGEA